MSEEPTLKEPKLIGAKVKRKFTFYPKLLAWDEVKLFGFYYELWEEWDQDYPEAQRVKGWNLVAMTGKKPQS